MVVDTESRSKNEVFCSRLRCRKLLGCIVEDGLAIEIGGAKIWHVVTLCCLNCNRPFRFEPKNIDRKLYDSLELEEGVN
jgi:hypothetical protein